MKPTLGDPQSSIHRPNGVPGYCTALPGILAALTVALLAGPSDLLGQEAPVGGWAVVKVLAGNPDSAGHFAVRISYPPGFRTRPHHHSVDLTGKVRRGTLMQGWGTSFDTTLVHAFPPGSRTVIEGDRNHFDWWPEGGELDIEGEGPMTTILVDSTGKPLAPRSR